MLCGALPAQAGLRIGFDARGLDADEVAASAALANEALARLPPALKHDFGRELRVRWRGDLPALVHGRAVHGGIALNRALLDAWMASGDAPVPRESLAALLHEIAHVYDRNHARLSADARLRDLAGWQVRPLRFGQRQRRNDFRDRSPDAHELHSPAEFFAVNFEHFLLDPAHACRRPALHRYFAVHFDWSPPQEDCVHGFAFVLADEGNGTGEWLRLDPARVYAVDYLLAEGNERAMSRWGHSMLRLVVCAPGREPGPDCRLDLQHHRVLSFRAFVDDVQISSWRGLTGSYPSRLFVLPLEQVIDEYTRIELRGLRSIPLRLHADDIASLLERAAQVHWSYDGRYYFVGNNCAVETWKLLQAGVPRLDADGLRSIAPNALLRRLVRAGIADESVLDDADEAIRAGYRFESLAAYFDDMFALADERLGLPVADARAWVALPPPQRRPWLENADLRAAAALLLLERAALRRDELLARDELKRLHARQGQGRGELARMAEALRELIRDGAHAGRPALLLDDEGYGLPQQDELDQLASRLAGRGEGMAPLRETIMAEAIALLPMQRRQRIEGARENLRLLGDRLRVLQVGEGG